MMVYECSVLAWDVYSCGCGARLRVPVGDPVPSCQNVSCEFAGFDIVNDILGGEL